VVWGSTRAGQDLHSPLAHVRGPPPVRGLGKAGTGQWPPVGGGYVATRSGGGPTVGPGMGDRCVGRRCLRLPSHPTAGPGILVTACQSPAAYDAASPCGPSVGGRPRGAAVCAGGGYLRRPPGHATPCAPPEGVARRVRPQGEVPPTARGHQCCVQGQDLSRCHPRHRCGMARVGLDVTASGKGAPASKGGGPVSGVLVVAGVGGRPAPHRGCRAHHFRARS